MAPAFSACIQRRVVAAVLALPLFAAPAFATTIERVVSPGGIEAWLVHEPAVPMIAVDFAFGGGGLQNPPAKGAPGNLALWCLTREPATFNRRRFTLASSAKPSNWVL